MIRKIVSSKEQQPGIVTFTNAELTDEERISLTYLGVINYNSEEKTVYLQASWYYEYHFETNEPSVYAHIATAIVRTRLNQVKTEWLKQRKSALDELTTETK